MREEQSLPDRVQGRDPAEEAGTVPTDQPPPLGPRSAAGRPTFCASESLDA